MQKTKKKQIKISDFIVVTYVNLIHFYLSLNLFITYTFLHKQVYCGTVFYTATILPLLYKTSYNTLPITHIVENLNFN